MELFSSPSTAIDFSHYSHFPNEYSDQFMEIASGSGDEDEECNAHELDLQEQLLRGADYADQLELSGLDEEMDEDYAMDDAYWQSDSMSMISSSISIHKATAPLVNEDNDDDEDSMVEQSDSDEVENGSDYDEESDDEDEGPLCKRSRRDGDEMERLKRQPACVIASSSEMLRIRFPFQSLSVRLSDYLCLREGDFINDTVIDFYLNHIVEHLLPEEPDRRVTVLPSVFWHNLSLRQSSLPDDFADMSVKEKERARFEDILEFVADFELFDVDYVCIPVNEWEHWSLIIVCHPFTPSARIICFDSQYAADANNLSQASSIISDFFQYAYSERNGTTSTFPPLTAMIPNNLVQQENHYDCGLYVLEYARRFLLAPPPVQNDPFDFGALYGDFSVESNRSEIQRVILSLCANRSNWEKLIGLIHSLPSHIVSQF